jgi:hypothetical protein
MIIHPSISMISNSQSEMLQYATATSISAKKEFLI